MEEMSEPNKKEKPLKYYHTATLIVGIIAFAFPIYSCLTKLDGWIVPEETILFIVPSFLALFIGVMTFIKRFNLSKTQLMFVICIILLCISWFWIEYAVGR